jgi:hypothetical protein
VNPVTVFSITSDSDPRVGEEFDRELSRSPTFLEQVDAAQSVLIETAQTLRRRISESDPLIQLRVVIVLPTQPAHAELANRVIESGIAALVRSLSREFAVERLRINAVVLARVADPAPLVDLLLDGEGAPFIGQMIVL